MPGLNLFTGTGEMTLDFDFKHIFKRICMLIRSPAGIVLNNGHIINSMMLARYLSWLPACDEQAVTKLLHPDDPQDVPHAVELMLAVIEFSKSQHTLISDSFSINVDTCADLTSISLLSALLQSILIPFIDIDLSLSQQFEHLSRYAHLAFAFFHAHHHSFMSYQLYYDMQTMVKNAFFCLAKQQCLDPRAPFFLGDVRDDPLEILFGCTHMIGGHNSACSYAQALDRLAAAKDIDGLNLAHYSYVELFTATSSIDMLCPFGQNKYLGISGTDDELDNPSQVPRPPPPITTSPTSQCLLETVLSEDGVEAQSNQPHTIDPLSPPLPQGPGICPDNYLLYSGRWIHKQTVCRLVVNKDFISKSLNLLEHIRAGYTKVNKRIDMSAGRITNQNLFLVGDIFLTILRSTQTLSIGILHSTTATLSGISRSSINIGVMKASRTTVKITGQLLSIISTRPLPDISQVFLWDSRYITARSVIQGSSQSTERVIVVTVPGSLVEPVNPEPTFIRLRDDINVDEFLQVNGGQSTWQIS
ncbi:hypothetical protein DFJ58DRAFT_729031 [Suillus subalutaceus]|uniref:uncharacterized protein n=1 Tax=Suillus subalutaceus TaxID=48586 RepID=UPI001B86C464|nr:uncharacterized protein DFJ58DRAFT_729031 [Suillus subalutaceus]KAG1851050.1 hypothetical protein DFJ58DRAFT_729031 [Suillus subalutaceus]